MFAIVQIGQIGTDRFSTREAAQCEADRLNAEADEECGEEVIGDGAACVIEVWTKDEAIEYVRGCGEHDGPDSYDDAARIFAALYGRAPSAEDGDQGSVWSLCCAAVD